MLRLKEKPIEWIKFTAVMGLVLNIVLWLMWWRGRIPLPVAVAAAVVAVVALVLSLIRPRWFRGFYRGGMTVSFHIGQVIGKVMLTLFFFLLVTPLGLALRLMGKDLLRLKHGGEESTWWQPAKNNREFDRLF
ncbi:MAG: SxtJ family membrane protein [Verrucomicrobia bacterium]|jgi:hypothetical protein|nr:SxtJ family membrane protein [Verrucomicrobiota bacterium]